MGHICLLTYPFDHCGTKSECKLYRNIIDKDLQLKSILLLDQLYTTKRLITVYKGQSGNNNVKSIY